MNIDIFIIARLGSTRFPSKHLMKINHKEVIKFLLDRLYQCNKIRKIIVCTTTSASDDKLANFLHKENVEVFRGSEKDILTRILDAAKKFQTDVIIDVEGDKVFTDPYFVDAIAMEFDNSEIDFVIGTNEKKIFDPTDHFIHGLIPAGIRTSSLVKACKYKKTSDSETGYKEIFLKNNFAKKKFYEFNSGLNNSKKIRLTLDYKDDLKLICKIVDELGENFSYVQLIELFKSNPSLQNLTSHLTQKWEENYRKNLMDLT